jgi:hypothetical protein
LAPSGFAVRHFFTHAAGLATPLKRGVRPLSHELATIVRTVLSILIVLAAACASRQDGLPQNGHTLDIAAVKFSPDDTQLLSYSPADGRLILWDIQTGHLLWIAKTEFLRKAGRLNILREFHWTHDGRLIVTRTDDKTYQYWDAQSGRIQRTSPDPPATEFAEEVPIAVSVRHEGEKYFLHDSRTGKDWVIRQYSRTGNAFDLSHDGTQLADGGSYGDAGVRITDLVSGKHRTFYGREAAKRLLPYRPGALELEMARELNLERARLKAKQAERDKQAAVETPQYTELVYVTFEHYGDMKDPGELRLAESGTPDMSEVSIVRENANALWVRLHNDSPLPIKIPTNSMYPLDRRCFYESPNGSKLFGLCDGWEIGLWFGVRSSTGKPTRYGFDFGGGAVLLPNTSVLFAVPRGILRNGNAIVFSYAFQKDDPDKVFANYGTEKEVQFNEADLLGEKQ